VSTATFGVWPESTPQDDGLDIKYEGPRPADLERAACTECGMNVWRARRGPYVAEYDTGAICGYCSYECYFSHRHRNNLEEIAGSLRPRGQQTTNVYSKHIRRDSLNGDAIRGGFSHPPKGVRGAVGAH
jgi:hypothetical protein